MKKLLYIRNEKSISLALFIAGAFGYAVIELLYRGRTHWSMMLTGGACLVTFYYIDKALPDAGIVIKALFCSVVVTIYEFFVGCIVNVWFGLCVWDYSDQPFALMGQICPVFSFVWFLLALGLAAISRFIYNVIDRPGGH